MTSPRCRLLPYELNDGPHQMAADEAMLHSAAAGTASLRFYGWSTPTLSLGYFQSEQVRRQNQRLAQLPHVRRPTGGATLIHHHEVTYALALPAGPPWQTGSPWPCRMHGIIALALANLGIGVTGHEPCLHPATACLSSSSNPVSTLNQGLCFHHFTPGDLMLAGRKIAGSAQRRQRRALLQHGGILLAQSPFAPDLLGIRELSEFILDPPILCRAIQTALAEETGWQLVASNWEASEIREIEELASGKYRSMAWNGKR